jgi:hypothetical protein
MCEFLCLTIFRLFAQYVDAPKPSVVTSDDVDMFKHASKPVMLAAKQAHKKSMRKITAKWWELLDTSSSEEDCGGDEASGGGGVYYDEDALATDAMNMRRIVASVDLNDKVNSERAAGRPLRANRAFANSERNQLKTKCLRQAMTQMMAKTPEKMRIWQADLVPAIDNTGQHAKASLYGSTSPMLDAN